MGEVGLGGGVEMVERRNNVMDGWIDGWMGGMNRSE